MSEPRLTGQKSDLFSARELQTRKASPLVLVWADELTRQNAWPEGKSVPGFEKWLRSQFYKAGKESRAMSAETGIPHDAGHGSRGADTLTNVAPQVRFGVDSNQLTVDKSTGQVVSDPLDHVRTRTDLMDVDADFKLSQAFEQYLNEGVIDPKSQLSLKDFEAKYRQKILHGRDYAPTALAAEGQAQLDRLTDSFREQAGYFPEVDNTPPEKPVKIVKPGKPPATVITPPDADNPYGMKRKVKTAPPPQRARPGRSGAGFINLRFGSDYTGGGMVPEDFGNVRPTIDPMEFTDELQQIQNERMELMEAPPIGLV